MSVQNELVIEKLRPIQYEIIEELCKAFHDLKSPVGFLAALGSWGDTLPESEVLVMLREMNSKVSSSDKAVLIEHHSESGVEWCVSFNGSNPVDEDCVRCFDKENAVKLQRILAR